MAENIRAVFIFEILGRPPEHVKSSLEQFIESIKDIKGVKILNSKVHEPHLFEDPEIKDLYSTFAEVELEIDNVNILFSLIFNRLPSSVEIIEPSEIRLKNFDLSSISSELTSRLHGFDEVVKGLNLERNIFASRLKEAEEKIKIMEQNAAVGRIVLKSNTNPPKKDEETSIKQNSRKKKKKN